MSELFRKTSLEKLSSPEQLDKMIVITPPSLWLAISGAGIIIASALTWSALGKLPVNMEASGIYISGKGVYTVHSETAGIVESIEVSEGGVIKKGDVIGYLDSKEVEKKIEDYEKRIEDVKKITMDSDSDVVTADNKSLVDIKAQMLTLDDNYRRSQALLELQMSNVALQRQKAGLSEQMMRAAENEYYKSLNTADSTAEQLALTESQNSLSSASSYLEAAYNSLDQATVAFNQINAVYQDVFIPYSAIVAQEAALDAVVQEKIDALENAYIIASEPLGLFDISNLAAYAAHPALSGNFATGAALRDAYDTALAAYNAAVAANSAVKAALKADVDKYKVELDAAAATRDNYQNDVNNYSAQKNTALNSYEKNKENYLNKLSSLGRGQSGQSKLSNEYNKALSDNSTQQASLTGMVDTLKQLEVQAENDRQTLEEQQEVLFNQFEATKASVIDGLKKECEESRKLLKKCEVVSSVDGTISDVAVVPGSAVNEGSELLRVRQGDGTDNKVVCYVSLNSGKKISEGMKVLIYPTTVNKQEYGHMEGTVKKVDSYVASTENLRIQLGNDGLVEAFLKDGPVVAVECEIREDSNTSSGYYWSSRKGRELLLAEGTLVEASVVLEEKAPITMLIPYLKEKLTIKADNAD